MATKSEKLHDQLFGVRSARALRSVLDAFGEARIRPKAATIHHVLEVIDDPEAEAAVDAFTATYGLELDEAPVALE